MLSNIKTWCIECVVWVSIYQPFIHWTQFIQVDFRVMTNHLVHNIYTDSDLLYCTVQNYNILHNTLSLHNNFFLHYHIKPSEIQADMWSVAYRSHPIDCVARCCLYSTFPTLVISACLLRFRKVIQSPTEDEFPHVSVFQAFYETLISCSSCWSVLHPAKWMVNTHKNKLES